MEGIVEPQMENLAECPGARTSVCERLGMDGI